MPPKRKAAAAKAGGKKAKVEEPATDSKSDVKKAVEALKTAEKGKKKTFVVDSYYPGVGSVRKMLLITLGLALLIVWFVPRISGRGYILTTQTKTGHSFFVISSVVLGYIVVQ